MRRERKSARSPCLFSKPACDNLQRDGPVTGLDRNIVDHHPEPYDFVQRRACAQVAVKQHLRHEAGDHIFGGDEVGSARGIRARAGYGAVVGGVARPDFLPTNIFAVDPHSVDGDAARYRDNGVPASWMAVP